MDTEDKGKLESEEVGRYRTALGYEIVLTSVPSMGDGLLMTVFMMQNKEPVKWELYLDADVLSTMPATMMGHAMAVAVTDGLSSFANMLEQIVSDEEEHETGSDTESDTGTDVEGEAPNSG